MINNMKLFAALVACLIMSACASTPIELDRTVFEEQKIEQVRFNELKQNLSIELSSVAVDNGAAAGGLIGALIGGAIDASVNSGRRAKFDEILKGLEGYDANKELEKALSAALIGEAFSSSLTVTSDFNKKDRKPVLLPLINPSIVMSPNYGVIDILLAVSTYQRADDKRPYDAFYSSQQLVEDDGITVDKAVNRLFWIQNPDVLSEKISEGIKEVVQQFSDDFNGINIEQGVDQSESLSSEPTN